MHAGAVCVLLLANAVLTCFGFVLDLLGFVRFGSGWLLVFFWFGWIVEGVGGGEDTRIKLGAPWWDCRKL